MKTELPRCSYLVLAQHLCICWTSLTLAYCKDRNMLRDSGPALFTYLVYKLFHSGLEPPDLKLHSHQLVGTHDGLMTISPAFP